MSTFDRTATVQRVCIVVILFLILITLQGIKNEIKDQQLIVHCAEDTQCEVADR